MNKIFSTLAAVAFSVFSADAINYNDLCHINVNEQVTTVITASEPIKFVDISTDKVVGDQPINNTIRVKPKDAEHHDGDILAIITIVTERYRTQYALIYRANSTAAITDKEIKMYERTAYDNPAVSMSTTDMFRFARLVWTSPARYHNVCTKKDKLVMRLNNIYAVGDYFFIDYSIDNKTNIRFDIDEIRVKLSDKKILKAANSQMLELKPEMILDQSTSFKHGYRNVLVLKKMTFPNNKILTIEMSEKQISGRTISININYNDILNADAYSSLLFHRK